MDNTFIQIPIQKIGNQVGPVDIPVFHQDTEQISFGGIVYSVWDRLNGIFTPARMKHLIGGRGEKEYTDWQLKFRAMLTPLSCVTVRQVRQFWGMELSHRQAMYVTRFGKNLSEQRKFFMEHSSLCYHDGE